MNIPFRVLPLVQIRNHHKSLTMTIVDSRFEPAATSANQLKFIKFGLRETKPGNKKFIFNVMVDLAVLAPLFSCRKETHFLQSSSYISINEDCFIISISSNFSNSVETFYLTAFLCLLVSL